MAVYYAKNITATTAGSRVVGVKCDRCSCDYFYELARVGTGSGYAPYALGTDGATRKAEEHSQSDLIDRLSVEAELVPCPSCQWINEELIQGYRRGRFRRLVVFGVISAIIGTASSLVGAWFLSNGPAADRGAIPYFLLGGPALSISFAVGLFLIRKLLTSRIQPNRNFPAPPKPVPGSPPALLLDESSGKLQLAGSTEADGGGGGHLYGLTTRSDATVCRRIAVIAFCRDLPSTFTKDPLRQALT